MYEIFTKLKTRQSIKVIRLVIPIAYTQEKVVTR